MPARSLPCRIAFLTLLVPAVSAAEAEYAWQLPQATVSPTGDLTWAPRPFVFVAGPSVRYIDFEQGSDERSGEAPGQAWKHHPWDAAAIAKAADGAGVHTYVFKRGVTYRGALIVENVGIDGQPIRLTSDPAWGTGEAVIAGSDTVTGWKRGKAPAGCPAADRVWSAEVDFLPRNVWILRADGETVRLPLARTPNWTISDQDDIKKEWWTWQNSGPGIKRHGNTMSVGHQTYNFATDPAHLSGDLSIHHGAYLWTEYGWVMGTPFPSKVQGVDQAKHGLAFGSQWSDSANSRIVTGMRYYLEDKAAYLDDPKGEFWFERHGDQGTLHVILPDGLTPDAVRVEAARHATLIDAAHMDHLDISGLTFRFTNTFWDLDAVAAIGMETEPAVIRLHGPGQGIAIHHCRFVDVNKALLLRADGASDRIDRVAFTDNEVLHSDQNTVVISDGSSWGQIEGPFGSLGSVELLRNRLRFTGMRPTRYGQGHALEVDYAEVMHVAGNILDRTWGSGIFLFGGKSSSSNQDNPFVRILVHHNKVTSSLLNTNDWGGIETWQGGPAYVFANISGDPGGFWHYNFLTDPANARFGHAYYLDGAFKNYHFNNIAWGKSHDPASPLVPTSAFQEIISYQNTFFNNTVHNFRVGSRRQNPSAGRDKFLGNIWDGIGLHAFRHADPAKGQAEANAKDAGNQSDTFAYDTNAYGTNLFHAVPALGLFESSGVARDDLGAFSTALTERKSLRTDIGVMLTSSPIPRAGERDFTPSAAADGKGVKVFVPWSLFRCVAEWNFYTSAKDGLIIDEHWDMPAYFCGRDTYHQQPMFALVPHGITDNSFVMGQLEDWTRGAVKLDGDHQYLSLANDLLTAPVTYELNHVVGPKAKTKEQRTVSGEGLKNPQIHASNFLIEAVFQVATTARTGVLIEKLDAQAGYGISLADGRPVFTVLAEGKPLAVTGDATLNDGAWHHLVAECDRATKRLTLHVDGRVAGQAPGPGPITLANSADLVVGGTAKGRCLAVTLDFLRICQGTLADARTSIDELRAWEFDGPFLRDFSGRPVKGAGRDAGAIEGGD